MDKKEGIKLCICKVCPTYIECEEEIAFCLSTKSKCIKKENGCLCPGCPVYGKMKFKKMYYCIHIYEENDK